MEKVFTIPEVAATLRCSLPTAYDTVRSGRLAAVRVGKQWRVAEGALREFLGGGGGGQGKAGELPAAL